MDVEQRARELLAAEWSKMDGCGQHVAEGIRRGADLPLDLPAIRAIMTALTPQEGHVVVTRNEAGQAVAVTRQDNEGRILSVIAEFEPPEGYVLVPVQPTEAMQIAGEKANVWLIRYEMPEVWAAMLAARPEVTP